MTKIAVVALLISFLVSRTVGVLVLLSGAKCGAVVMVRMLVGLLLGRAGAMPGLTIRTAVIDPVLIADLLRLIAPAVVHSVGRTIGAGPIAITVPIRVPVISQVAISLIVSCLIGPAVIVVVELSAIIAPAVAGPIFLSVLHALAIGGAVLAHIAVPTALIVPLLTVVSGLLLTVIVGILVLLSGNINRAQEAHGQSQRPEHLLIIAHRNPSFTPAKALRLCYRSVNNT